MGHVDLVDCLMAWTIWEVDLRGDTVFTTEGKSGYHYHFFFKLDHYR